MTPEQTDALAAWWRSALDDIKATLTPGGPGWADVQAKLAIIREYEVYRNAADSLSHPDNKALAVGCRDTLGWVMRTLALPYAADREGWIDMWRVQ